MARAAAPAGGSPASAEGRADSGGPEGLGEHLGDAGGGIGVEVVCALVGAPGVNRHGANSPLVGSHLLRVPGGQVRCALEERSPPVEGHRGDASLGEDGGRVVGQGLQARAPGDLGRLRGPDSQEQVPFGVEVEGVGVGAEEGAGGEGGRGVQVCQGGEGGEGLGRGCGGVRGGCLRIEENLARLRVHDGAPGGVSAGGGGSGDGRPQFLDVGGVDGRGRGLGPLRGNRGVERGERRGRRGGGTGWRATGDRQRRRAHKSGASAYNCPHRRALHGCPFVVTSVATVPVPAPTQPPGPPSFGG